ncbi:MAG: hypothetical protein Ct9H300mP9_6480 [Candidatus Neomarinimicrobiota bacterium]|nr:MAG: hypothetical protein Ct9H300mP9_6480 [Candidatus Neomarinimicrobiota bacterium]
MDRIIRWFIANSVAANLLMFFIIFAGFFTLSQLRMEIFPDINLGIINVSVVYPGASPEDIEESICIRIEEQIAGVDGVKRITRHRMRASVPSVLRSCLVRILMRSRMILRPR